MICLVVAQSLNNLVIFISYRLNTKLIEQQFCENKNKIRLQCHGKCHLKKQIQQEEQKDKMPVNNLKEKNTIILFFVDGSPEENNSGKNNGFIILNVNLHYASPVFCIYHPPQFISC